MRSALLRSPLVGQSPLTGTFKASRGFAVTFTDAGAAELEQRLPALGRFLSLVLSLFSSPTLWPWSSQLRPSSVRPCNAFYLNLLVLSDGSGVGRHLDGTLRGPSGEGDAVPRRVSVLYLSGGAALGSLRLWREARCLARVDPVAGAMVHFRGDLDHEVLPGLPGEVRASLVCEQYTLTAEALARLPPLRMQSKAGFAAHLEDHRRRSGPRSS